LKLVSYRNSFGELRVGAELPDGGIADLTVALETYLVSVAGVDASRAAQAAEHRIPPSMLDLLRRGKEGQKDVRLALSHVERSGRVGGTLWSPMGQRVIKSMDEVTLATPVPQVPRQVFSMEYNYPSYETVHHTVPPFDGETAVFMIDPETVIGPDGSICWPRGAGEVTASVELGVVIGRQGKGIGQADALDHVAGYTVVIDVTGMWLVRDHPGEELKLPRAFELARSMNIDTFTVVGPAIVTADELPDPQALGAELKVNDRTLSQGNTRDMRCSVARLIEYLSRYVTLDPGDLIMTGSIGTFDHPPEAAINCGDVLEADIDSVGTLVSRVVG
jgi:2-keto-4-pentenoate hydratase/2-oxohepta-3-ene-1,7-dioic acid hydratase in catechol pathway